MLKQLNKLEKQYGGAIPFSALSENKKGKKDKEDKKKDKKKGKTKQKKTRRSLSKKEENKKQRKRTISPARARRKITKRTKRSKKKTIREKKDKNRSCGSHTYTGREDTPEGLGKCSECIPLNVVMKGKDNKLYENRKEGWVRIN